VPPTPAVEADLALPGPPTRWVSYVLIGFGVAVLAVFAATTNVRQLGGALRGVRADLLGLAVGGLLAQLLVKALRWRFMVRQIAGTQVSLRFATLSVVAGVAAGSITPARGFEVAKAMLLRGTHGVPLSLSTSAMIVERMLDLLMLIVALLLAALLLPRRMVSSSGILLLLIAAVLGGSALVVTAPERMRGWGAALLRALPGPETLRRGAVHLLDTFFTSLLLWKQSRTLGVLLALTAVVAVLDLVRVCAVFWAIGASLSAPFLAFTYIGAALLGMAFLIPGGVGVTEVSQVGLIILLAPGAVPSAVARSAVLVDRFLSYYLLTLIGAGILIAYHRLGRVFR
jgi:glycosyltransferase 2 family protein